MVAQTRNYTVFDKTLPRMLAIDDGYMTKWRYEVMHCSPSEVTEYCVNNANWQEFRLTLKGLSTYVKLANLERWRMLHAQQAMTQSTVEVLPRRTQVQIDNYITALKRGGQLDMDLRVQR